MAPLFAPLVKNNVSVVGNLVSEQTMVFVHGFGTDQTAWRDVSTPFLADFRVILLDNVGAGQSPPEAFVQHHYLDLQRYATDLLEICTALQVKDAVLVCHSVGAMIGVLAATQQSKHFSRLVLIGASPRYLNDVGYHGGFTEDDLNGLYSAMRTSYSEWADQFAPTVMQNEDRPTLAQHFAATIKSIPPDRALTVLCAIFQSDHRADVQKLRLPTLLIHANDDRAVPMDVANYLHKNIPGSELVVIPVSGHLPHISAPAEVLAVMRGFVRA